MGDHDVFAKNYQFETTPEKFNNWFSIFVSFFVWAFLYQFITHKLTSKNEEYCCRVLTLIHGFLTSLIGVSQCFNSPFSHPDWPTTNSQRFLMVCSLGYFIHDLIWLLIYDTTSKLMLGHHIYSVVALYRMLYKEKAGGQATCSLGSMEITNPILQMRWFLRSEGFYPSKLYTFVEICFMIIFFVIRIVLGTYFLFAIVLQLDNDWEFRVLSGTIYAMSWMFMINIVKYFIKKYILKKKEETQIKEN